MVKVHKMFCVEYEMAEKLKNMNGSELVNSLLIEYFKKNDIKYMTQEERTKKIEELKIRVEAEEKIEAIKNE